MLPSNKEEVIKRAYNKARIYTPKYHSCSNGTALALMETFNITDSSVFKAASGLHGGIGGMGDVCGSLLGASLILGLVCGAAPKEPTKRETEEPEKPGAKDVLTQLVAQLYKWFRKEFGSVKCRIVRSRFERELNQDIHNRGLTDDEKQTVLFARCDELTAKTAARAAEILWEIIETEKKRAK
ncbi:MAG: C-GCAxxG-C-C family protein [Thermodesulfobacteriota bacterium]|jgi:C_GCAxxG_C_C family probable redox protein